MKLLSPIAILLLIMTSCTREFDSDTDVNNPTTEEDCHTVLCDLSLRSLTARVVDKNGEPVIVSDDEVSVYYTESEEAIEIGREVLSDLSAIFIISDNYEVAFEGTSITVEIRKNKFKTVKKEFIVARDCCHVYNPEGQVLEITI